MKKLLLRLALPMLLPVIEASLRDALKDQVKVPDVQRKTLNKLGFGEAKIAAVDARVQNRIVGEVLAALEEAVK